MSAEPDYDVGNRDGGHSGLRMLSRSLAGWPWADKIDKVVVVWLRDTHRRNSQTCCLLQKLSDQANKGRFVSPYNKTDGLNESTKTRCKGRSWELDDKIPGARGNSGDCDILYSWRCTWGRCSW